MGSRQREFLSAVNLIRRDVSTDGGSDLSRNRPAVTDGWLEESKKINDEILSYEKIYDTAYFNQSTLSDESKNESNALLSDSKESEDAIFNESFRFRRGIGKGSTNGSEDPSGTLSGETRIAVSHLSHITHAMSRTSTE